MVLDRLTLGLWIRMLVAGVVAGVGMVVLVVAEVAFAALMAAAFIEAIPEFALIVLGLVAVVAVTLGLWITVAATYRRLMPAAVVVGRVSHDGMADALEPLARGLANPTVPVTRRGLAIAVGGPVLAFAGSLAIDLLPVVTPFVLGFALGVGLVCYGTGRLVYEEVTADGAVRDDIAETARVPASDDAAPSAHSSDADPDDDLEAERRAIQARVDRLAAQGDAPAPTVRLGRSSIPVAASVGYRPSTSSIVVSRGLVDRLSERELEAVLAHELAHVINRDAAVLTALSLPATKVEAMFAGSERHGDADDRETNTDPSTAGPHSGFVLVAAVPVFLVTALAIASLARYREYVADRGAIALSGDPAALASALETLDRDVTRRPGRDLRGHGSTAAFGIVPPPWEEHRFFDRTRRFVRRRLFGTHPPTERRIRRLERTARGPGQE